MLENVNGKGFCWEQKVLLQAPLRGKMATVRKCTEWTYDTTASGLNDT